jgi:bud site selection protein 20
MGCKQSRKKKNPNNTKHLKTKRRTRDIDQVHEDLKDIAKSAANFTVMNEDLPGLGFHYCVSCARHFQTEGALKEHSNQKVHKRRLKEAQLPPHTQETAEAAVGYSTAK